MKADFYDIESLTNVFTLANFREHDNATEIYYLVDDPTLITSDFEQLATDRIHKKNKNFTGTVEYYDLRNPESNYRLARTFGLSDVRYMNNPDLVSAYNSSYRLVCDTDPYYSEDEYPYLFGYNSYNYDTTMLTWYLYNTIDPQTNQCSIQTAQSMRNFNDELFTPQFKEKMYERLRYEYKDPCRPALGYLPANYSLPTAVIRKNMLMSGRHIDVAKLNEKQSKVGLKRLLGMTGYQILESDKLRPGQDSIENTDQLCDLIAYNVSDIINLKELFYNKTYQSNFSLKKQLLKDYPDLIYNEISGQYKPDIRPQAVRNDRLTIDSSSAQFATKALCPYGHLQDYDTVSFWYPSKAKAEALGIPQINVLEESKKFFYANFPQPEIRAKFDAIYNYYKAIEGKNFNSSNNYLMDHDIDPDMVDAAAYLPDELAVHKLSEIPLPNTCMFYYNKDGTPSTCFVNFSTGGIHGAEYNAKLAAYDAAQFELKMDDYRHQVDLFNRVKAMYPDPCDLKKAKSITIDGEKYTASKFLKPKATTTSAYYKEPKPPVNRFEIFQKSSSAKNDSYSLNSRYAYTSAALTNHEDFTSYYPNLLRQMDAFFNQGLGYDRYGEIFDNKTKFGKLMKDESLEQAERDKYAVMREGTKLVLNSASGAADANFESNIRMNNKIISMRIIGQLFTWRIGQAQTIEGASMISTNTDGLYSVLEAEFNNMILARESANIHVEIEPEPIYLISKDSNNRAEIKIDGNQLGKITGASGGTLACRKGPSPTKSLAHPAIIDWALTEYLAIASVGYKGLSLEKPFNDEIGMNILMSARKQFNDDFHSLLMFQNVIASSPGSQRFVFATKTGDPTPIPLQHYNRCFIVKDTAPNTYHLKTAAAKVITDSSIEKRQKNNERPQQHDPIAASILAVNGVKVANLPYNKEATIVKLTGIEEEWSIRIENSDLHFLSQEYIDQLFNDIDYDKYLKMLHDSYENNWMNVTPEYLLSQTKKTDEPKAISLFDESIPDASTITLSETNTTQVKEISAPLPKSEMTINDITPPKLISLQKTVLSQNDIQKGEHKLCMNGIREADSHRVLREVFKVVTDTDIDE